MIIIPKHDRTPTILVRYAMTPGNTPSYPNNVHSGTLEHIVGNVLRGPFVLRHGSGLQRHLRVRASCFSLGQRTWVDHHNALNDLFRI